MGNNLGYVESSAEEGQRGSHRPTEINKLEEENYESIKDTRIFSVSLRLEPRKFQKGQRQAKTA
jgi:hypothetical protein